VLILQNEMPDAVKIDSEFGTYTANYEVKDGQLVYTRSLVQRASDLTVGLRPVTNGRLTLTYEGQDISPEDLVLKLLNSYTEELVHLLTRPTPDSPKA